MNTPPPVAILASGLLTSVGSDAASCCAAFRSKLTNPTPTRFIDSAGDWIMAHQVALPREFGGSERLARMAATVAEEALDGIQESEWSGIALLLCLAERDRPGRLEGLDAALVVRIEALVGGRFAAESTVVAHGRVSVAVALTRARELLEAGDVGRALIVAVDSLLHWPTLVRYDHDDRLLRQDNSNGFMPGEGAGALLVGLQSGRAELLCRGIGFAQEAAHIDTEEPLRADGLVASIRTALGESGLQMHDFDYRIADLSGEQYYFKEASLALSRTMRQRKEEFDLWHPAECIGETGALAGVAIVAWACAAAKKGYAKGANVLVHLSADAGQRSALAFQYRRA